MKYTCKRCGYVSFGISRQEMRQAVSRLHGRERAVAEQQSTVCWGCDAPLDVRPATPEEEEAATELGLVVEKEELH